MSQPDCQHDCRFRISVPLLCDAPLLRTGPSVARGMGSWTRALAIVCASSAKSGLVALSHTIGSYGPQDARKRRTGWAPRIALRGPRTGPDASILALGGDANH